MKFIVEFTFNSPHYGQIIYVNLSERNRILFGFCKEDKTDELLNLFKLNIFFLSASKKIVLMPGTPGMYTKYTNAFKNKF